jgi:hypothetical protein
VSFILTLASKWGCDIRNVLAILCLGILRLEKEEKNLVENLLISIKCQNVLA